MTRSSLLVCPSLLALVVPYGALAQPAAAPAQAQTTASAPTQTVPEDEEAQVVIVTGQRPRGSVPGTALPETVLSPAEIRSYGASSLGELLTSLSPQTGSARGAARGGGDGFPIVLLNGRRIAGFREIQGLPPEAILRVETYSEEVALQYGYPPDRRVVNFILRERFRAHTVEVGAQTLAEGQSARGELEYGFLQIGPKGRTSLGFETARASAITEAERGIVRSGRTDSAFRTLTPDTETWQASANVNRALDTTTGVTFDARWTGSQSRSLLGLAADGGGQALRRSSGTDTFRGAVTLDGVSEAWQWTASAAVDTNSSDTTTQSAAGETIALSDSFALELAANASGALWEGPAGSARGSVSAGFVRRDLDAVALIGGSKQATGLEREEVSGRATLSVPLTSRRRDFGKALGDWTVNLNASVNDISDFSTLSGIGGGVNWSPVAGVKFAVLAEAAEAAPTLQQAGNPVTVTPNASVFDFATGQSVLVTRVSGGNPALLAESRRDLSFSATWAPEKPDGLELSASWASAVSEDALAGFPALTPALEAAFPSRFTRDGGGALTAIDTRPVNLAETRSELVRWGFSYSKGFGTPMQRPQGAGPRGGAPQGTAGASAPARPEGASGPGGRAAGSPPAGSSGGRPPGGGPPGGFRGGGPGGFGGFGGQGGGQPGRWSLSVFHTVKFEDTVLFRSGQPVIDLLDGGATASDGGSPRHKVELEGGWFYRGIGVRLTANWKSATVVRGVSGTGAGTTDLTFGDHATTDMRAWFNFIARPEWVAKVPFLRRSRVILRVDNLFDAAQEVTDSSGATPEAWQAGYLNPRGRVVEVGFRKQF